MKSKELSDLFNINGYFYKIEKHTFRKYLNIQKKSSNLKTPDLMVIMMNPGSSHPIGTNRFKEIPNNLYNSIVQTDPDNTQYQIMRVMIKCDFNYARILNLSDLCEPQSSCFYKKIIDLNNHQIKHSIFQDERISDLKELFESNGKLIVAWGVNKALKDLAGLVLDKKYEIKIGLNKENLEWAFYHPLPRNNKKQVEWVNEIVKQIK